MINKSNSLNEGYATKSTPIENFDNNTYEDARKQIQLLNKQPISNEPSQFNMNNAENRRIEQIQVSDTILNRFKEAEVKSTQMNNVLFSKEHMPAPQQPLEEIPNKYIPEIGEKRRLSNIIYNSLLKKFTRVKSSHISEKQVSLILNKMNLNKETKSWTKSEVKRFSTAIKRLIKHNYNHEIKSKQKLTTPAEELFERNTRNTTHYVAIDSRDRDRKIWPNSNEFRITFAPSSGAIFDNKDIGLLIEIFQTLPLFNSFLLLYHVSP